MQCWRWDHIQQSEAHVSRALPHARRSERQDSHPRCNGPVPNTAPPTLETSYAYKKAPTKRGWQSGVQCNPYPTIKRDEVVSVKEPHTEDSYFRVKDDPDKTVPLPRLTFLYINYSKHNKCMKWHFFIRLIQHCTNDFLFRTEQASDRLRVSDSLITTILRQEERGKEKKSSLKKKKKAQKS